MVSQKPFSYVTKCRRTIEGKTKLSLSPKSTKFQLSELPTWFPFEVSRSNAYRQEGKAEKLYIIEMVKRTNSPPHLQNEKRK